MAFKVGDKAFFIFGFAKRERDNISRKELNTMKEMAESLFGYSAKQLEKAVASGILIEAK